jgi:3-oxoacyl-[acyl-carrier-protein] synthase II
VNPRRLATRSRPGGAARRVVITGLGVRTPGAAGAEQFWHSLLQPQGVAASRPVPDTGVQAWMPARESRRLDRFAQLAVAAAGEALADAGLLRAAGDGPAAASGGLTAYDGHRAATVVGTGLGGLASFEAAVTARAERGDRRVSPLAAAMVIPNAAAAAVSMRFGLRGPCEAVTTACAAGTQSIETAVRMIAEGRADVALAGGAEGSLTPTMLAAYANMTALSRTGISRPFDHARDGFCAAEGAAVVVLEDRERALARGGTVLLEVLGAGSTADAFHVTAPSPRGAGAEACMRVALDDAALAPEDVTHVNAHGTSTPLNDAAEAAAIARVLGARSVPVTSVKGVTGHTLGAAGAVEVVAVALSVRHRTLPPTAGTTDVDSALVDLVDVVLEPRVWDPGPVLSNSFGFGGHNATLVLGPDRGGRYRG